MASSYLAEQSSMIIEGFICPECQQDMSSVELLQQHFLQVHSANNKSTTNNQSVYNGNNGKLSSEFSQFIFFIIIHHLISVFFVKRCIC